MNNCCSRIETLPDVKRALEELRSIQKIRVKTKMTSKFNIGEGITTMVFANIFKKYTGNIIIQRVEDKFDITVHSQGERAMIIPCDQIQSCSITKTTVTLQLREDYFAEKCILEFYSEEQVQMFQSKLPPIKGPKVEDNICPVSSDDDFNDSGNCKTSEANNSHSTDLSEHE